MVFQFLRCLKWLNSKWSLYRSFSHYCHQLTWTSGSWTNWFMDHCSQIEWHPKKDTHAGEIYRTESDKLKLLFEAIAIHARWQALQAVHVCGGGGVRNKGDSHEFAAGAGAGCQRPWSCKYITCNPQFTPRAPAHHTQLLRHSAPCASACLGLGTHLRLWWVTMSE